MRRIVITVVSLLAVLVHMQVGCCAHHVHGQPAADCEVAHHELAHHDHCDGPHQHSPASPVEPISHDDCHETHCATTLVSQVATPAPIVCGWWTPAGMLADATRFALTYGASADRPSDPTGAPPLRAHLRLAVLLI